MIEYLVIDVGNSRTKMAWFQAGTIQVREQIEGFNWPEILQLQTNRPAQNGILSSVGQVPPDDWIEQHPNWLLLDENTPLPFENTYHTPATLGRDRLAALAGAQALYPNEHCLIVDAGTCITMDLLTADGRFLGGNISPGIRMRLRSMHEGTARLPLVSTGRMEGLLGDSTIAALRHGGQLGAVLEFEGLVRRLEPIYQPLRCLITGGDADKFVEITKSRIFAHPDLVLYGLHKILEYNVEHLE